MHKGKEKKEKEEKITFSLLAFSTVRRNNEALWIYVTLEYLRDFIYKSYPSLCCVYLGPAPIS